MPLSVFLAVLLGAALHASWNAIVKGGDDKLLTTILIAAASSLIAALALPFLSMPARASWPYLAASTVAHSSSSRHGTGRASAFHCCIESMPVKASR